jgi:hypothetical protein
VASHIARNERPEKFDLGLAEFVDHSMIMNGGPAETPSSRRVVRASPPLISPPKRSDRTCLGMRCHSRSKPRGSLAHTGCAKVPERSGSAPSRRFSNAESPPSYLRDLLELLDFGGRPLKTQTGQAIGLASITTGALDDQSGILKPRDGAVKSSRTGPTPRHLPEIVPYCITVLGPVQEADQYQGLRLRTSHDATSTTLNGILLRWTYYSTNKRVSQPAAGRGTHQLRHVAVHKWSP